MSSADVSEASGELDGCNEWSSVGCMETTAEEMK